MTSPYGVESRCATSLGGRGEFARAPAATPRTPPEIRPGEATWSHRRTAAAARSVPEHRRICSRHRSNDLLVTQHEPESQTSRPPLAFDPGCQGLPSLALFGAPRRMESVENPDPYAQQPEPERQRREGRVLLVRVPLVLADLQTCGLASPMTVSALENAVEERRWWAAQWPEGHVYVAGLVAQDVQDALLETVGRWPLCSSCDDPDEHALYIHPELGGLNRCGCANSRPQDVAELGHLGPADGPTWPKSVPPTPSS